MFERKELVSPRYVTSGYDHSVARDRSDLRWLELSAREQWRERLRWARETHGSFARAEWFAKRVGESAPNYRKYERLPSPGANSAKDLPYQKAVAWAAELDVRWQWLLEGEGVPWNDTAEETPAARVERLVQGAPPEDQERILRVVEAMVGERKAG
jgi:hypothetical protein